MKTISLRILRLSLGLAAWLAVPGMCLSAEVCDGLSPELELACLQIYLDEYDTEATGFEINNALSGTWFNPVRDGEGFMIDVANAGHIVISFYTYNNAGQQMWLIGTGDVDGSVAVIEFYVAEGGLYGSAFVPGLVNKLYWGTGTFTFSECATGTAMITPGPDFSTEFESFITDITRLTVPVNCD